VHNRFVVEELSAKGAIFVDSVEEVPTGERVIYSAHGVSPEVREASHLRSLRVIDATCPLVTKVHVEAVRFASQGYTLVLIGHRDHDEVIGTLGEAPMVTQVVGSKLCACAFPISKAQLRRISAMPPKTANRRSST
jgi:4-hydroxy-3-methylbut-2-enyl diphosphate reductase